MTASSRVTTGSGRCGRRSPRRPGRGGQPAAASSIWSRVWLTAGMKAAMPTFWVRSVSRRLERSIPCFQVLYTAESRLQAPEPGGLRAPGDQVQDEEPEGLLSRDASGGGVRLRQVAFLGQVRHDVSNGRGAQGVSLAPGNSPGRHRLAGLDVPPDNRVQDIGLAARQCPVLPPCARGQPPNRILGDGREQGSSRTARPACAVLNSQSHRKRARSSIGRATDS